MSLAEAAAAGPPEDKRRPSKIDLWLESLPKDEREGAEAILANPEWRHVRVRDTFLRYGLDIGAQQIGDYRKARYESFR